MQGPLLGTFGGHCSGRGVLTPTVGATEARAREVTGAPPLQPALSVPRGRGMVLRLPVPGCPLASKALISFICASEGCGAIEKGDLGLQDPPEAEGAHRKSEGPRAGAGVCPCPYHLALRAQGLLAPASRDPAEVGGLAAQCGAVRGAVPEGGAAVLAGHAQQHAQAGQVLHDGCPAGPQSDEGQEQGRDTQPIPGEVGWRV